MQRVKWKILLSEHVWVKCFSRLCIRVIMQNSVVTGSRLGVITPENECIWGSQLYPSLLICCPDSCHIYKHFNKIFYYICFQQLLFSSDASLSILFRNCHQELPKNLWEDTCCSMIYFLQNFLEDVLPMAVRNFTALHSATCNQSSYHIPKKQGREKASTIEATYIIQNI